MKGQDKCDSTTWIINRHEGDTAVELVNLGKMKSDRLRVTESCSLVITNVTVGDAGRYNCKQFNKSGKQQGPDSVIYLSVVNSEYLHHEVFNSNCPVEQNTEALF